MELNSDDDNLPEFFRVYISRHSSSKLSIPGEFVKYMGQKKSGRAVLSGPNELTWLVELAEDGNDMYFSDGWQRFVHDNTVRDGDFLFFKFHGNMMFSFVIYDGSLGENRVIVLDDECRQENSDVREAGQNQEMVNKRLKSRARGYSHPKGFMFPLTTTTTEQIPTSVNPSFEKCISASSLNMGCYLMFPSSFVQEHSLSYKSREKMVLQTQRNLSWEVSVVNSYGEILLRKGWCAFARENNIRVGDVCKFELLGRLKMFVHVVHKHEGIGWKKVNVVARIRSQKKAVGVSLCSFKHGSIVEEQKAAATTMPCFVHPIFVASMNKYNVNSKSLASIPSWFIKENSLRYVGKEKMVLRTKTESWAVNIISCKNSHYLSGGWAAFVRDNNIKEGDVCKFELVNRLEMKVYITHGV